MWYLIIIGWIACGVLHYGMDFAYFQRQYPTLARKDHRRDRLTAFLQSLVGPIALIGEVLFLWNKPKHGLKFR